MSVHIKLRRAYHSIVPNHQQESFYSAILRLRRLFHLRPFLSYLEVQLADHCNLDCSGCSHFSPLADEVFADIKQYNRDMKRLSQLIANIEMIRLIGGEPLLNPKVSMFLDSTRKWFPKADIHLVTNGILLPSMNTEFWESCRRNSILIDVTLYPPLFSKKTELLLLAKSKGTAINAVETATFRVTTNSKGDSELEKTFRRCRKLGYWPILRQGRVYQCAKPAYGHYFNKAFGTTIPTGGSVDIFDHEVTGWKVLSLLEKSPEACRFCTYGWEKVPTQAWAKSRLSRKEWDVAEQ